MLAIVVFSKGESPDRATLPIHPPPILPAVESVWLFLLHILASFSTMSFKLRLR